MRFFLLYIYNHFGPSIPVQPVTIFSAVYINDLTDRPTDHHLCYDRIRGLKTTPWMSAQNAYVKMPAFRRYIITDMSSVPSVCGCVQWDQYVRIGFFLSTYIGSALLLFAAAVAAD